MAKEREPAIGVVIERGPHRTASREWDPAAPLLGFDVELHVHIVELLVVGTDDNDVVVAVDAGADHLHAVPDLAGRAPSRPGLRARRSLPGMVDFVAPRADHEQI